MKFEYGEKYKQYNTDGEINIGTGTVMVHDIFNKTPEFMKEADVVFCDPPYNIGALKGYYTKAGIDDKPSDFEIFLDRLYEVIEEINPDIVVIESGKAQTDMHMDRLLKMYVAAFTKESWYYGNKKNKCDIIIATKYQCPEELIALPEMDEEKVIKYICENVDYKCIADPCMGQGLVAFYSNKAGKKFVGTELNFKRLAVCIDRVLTGKR